MSNPYCAPADTQRIYATLELDEVTDLTLDDVMHFQDELAAEINGILRAQGYPTVPATGANDVQMIGGYIAQKAAARIWRGYFQGSKTPDSVKTWDAEYERFVDRLSTGKQMLMDQSPTATVSGQLRVGRMRFRRVPPSGSEWGG